MIVVIVTIVIIVIIVVVISFLVTVRGLAQLRPAITPRQNPTPQASAIAFVETLPTFEL